MSAHKLFCYAAQRPTVLEFLHEVNAAFDDAKSLTAVTDAEQLRGLPHISFITVRNHRYPLPGTIRDTLAQEGALVIVIDDSYEKLHVHDAGNYG